MVRLPKFASVRDLGRLIERLINGDILQQPKLESFAVDSLPAIALAARGRLVYTTDGASGAPMLCFQGNSAWLRADTGSAAADGA